MGSYNRDNKGGGYQSRSKFGSNRGGFRSRGRSSFGSDRGSKEMFSTTCSNCGKPCEVPFRPTNGKPVYCSDCFEKMGGRDSQPRFEKPERSSFRSNNEFEQLNAKIDRILNLLEEKKETKAKKDTSEE